MFDRGVMEFIALDSELDILDSIWNIASEWTKVLNRYKDVHFSDIDPESIQNDIQAQYKEYTDTLRKYRDKDWQIRDHTFERIQTLWNILPLASLLKTRNIRKRHWNSLRDVMKTEFDETAPEFTLGQIIKLKFQSFAESKNDHSYEKFGTRKKNRLC
ncbi:dynein heavy chain 2, axonemal-like [Diaphorina citri]|uniref:Dynein heavy chain 2, axonemal-like n=1 Tax=Diaphorina citri TaxID=121845 RepID=A0A3Q0JDW1_DIACI|nr:dynein heavy chain 2, axonemal-like [Diaphorina citri]